MDINDEEYREMTAARAAEIKPDWATDPEPRCSCGTPLVPIELIINGESCILWGCAVCDCQADEGGK